MVLHIKRPPVSAKDINTPVMWHSPRTRSVPAPSVLRLFTGCLPIKTVEQPVNNRRTDGGRSEEGRPRDRIARGANERC